MKVKVNGAWVDVPAFVTSQGAGGDSKQFDEVYEVTLSADAVVSYTTEKPCKAMMVEIEKPAGSTSTAHRVNIGTGPKTIKGIITSSYAAKARFIISRFGSGFVMVQRVGSSAQEGYTMTASYQWIDISSSSFSYFTTIVDLPTGTKIKLYFIYD